MVVLWLVNLFNDTGLGTVYQTTQKARMVIFFILAVAILLKSYKQKIKAKRYDFWLFSALVLIFGFVSIINGYKFEGINYLYSFIVIYLLSKVGVNEYAIKLTGFAYLIMGLGVLFIYNYSSVLSGWNENTMGMIGLYSYLFFLISYQNPIESKNKITIIIVSILYFLLIMPTNSRSCIFFAIIFILFTFGIFSPKIIVQNENKYFVWLLLPLFIATFVVIFRNTYLFQQLNDWSINTFNKTVFNGRDMLWKYCFESISQNLLFGSGTFAGNWHNCVLTIMMGYGVVGTVVWILSLQRILFKGKKWIKDKIVSGCMVAFFMICFQQTVELGLVGENPNLIPYIILGMMLGRVRYLDNKYEKEGKDCA